MMSNVKHLSMRPFFTPSPLSDDNRHLRNNRSAVKTKTKNNIKVPIIITTKKPMKKKIWPRLGCSLSFKVHGREINLSRSRPWYVLELGLT